MTKILLAEDDKALREIYGVRLLAEGYDIVSAGDGEEALTSAINEHPDLIVSDVMMPKISGFEMIDLLRTNEKTRDIKVIVMSALGGESQKERGRSLGADRYLVKSQVGIEDVVATVKQVLAEPPRQASAPAGANPATPTPVPAPTTVPAATMPAAGQSAFNPVQATAPSTVTGTDQPSLPNTPLSVPTVMNPAPAPAQTPFTPAPAAGQSLPPIPLPSTQPPAQTQPIAPAQPAPQPVAPQPPQVIEPTTTVQQQQPSTAPVAPTAPAAAPPSATPAVGGVKVIQPTGVSMSPKINIDDLLAKEEAVEIAPGLNMNATVPTAAPVEAAEPTGTPAISIGQNGVIDLDAATTETASTFPASS